MALVQMRTSSGSYSMVDAALVKEYEQQGWTLTSDLKEFEGMGVVAYNNGKVTLEDGTEVQFAPTSTTTDTSDTTSIYDYQTGLSVAQATYSFLSDDLLDIYAKAWAKTGNPTAALGILRQSKEWERDFGYLRRDDGSLVMSEIDAMSNIYSFQETLSEYGITDTSKFTQQFRNLVASGVAPTEFQDRIDTVYNLVIDEIPKVRELFARNYGIEATDDAIFGALINKDVEDGLLNNEITTLRIEAQAASRGFNTTFEKFKDLRQRGLTVERAATLYESAADIMQAAKTVGRELDLSTLEEAALGDIQASKNIARTQADIAVNFGGITLGAAKKGKQITGLIED